MNIDRRTFLGGMAGVAALAACASALTGVSEGMFSQACADETSSGKQVVPGLCHSCHVAKCSINYTVEDGVLTGAEGNPDGPWNEGKACVRGLGAPAFVYNPYRVKKPMIRTNPEKGLDVDPQWAEIEYDEAIAMVAEKMAAIREDDPRKLVWLGGFPEFYNILGGMYGIVPAAFGTPNTAQVTGSLCSVHLSNGLVRGGFAQYPDWDRTKYIIAVGGTTAPNIAPGDGGTDFIVDRLQGDTRMICIDPRCSPEAALGEWCPIRPGTDFAYLLSLANVILHEENRYDEWSLKNRSTAVYLIDEDEEDYARDAATGKPMVWDPTDGKAKTFDDASIQDYALEGRYTVDGKEYATAFTLFKENVKDNTPEWAEEITTIPADTIRTHAKDFLDAACIGSTIELNGQELPYRPACVYVSRGMANHRDGHLAFWYSMMLNELVGAIDVPGGNVCAADPNALAPNEDGVVTPEDFHCALHAWQFPHENICAQEWVPYGFDQGFRVLDVMHDPDAYQADYIPEMFVSSGANYYNKAGDADYITEALCKYPFMMTIAYHVDEHALLSDLLIPDTTYIEQAAVYNFDMYRPGHGHLVNGTFGHKHIIDPVFGQRLVDDFWTDVAERAGFLYGPGQLNFLTNIILELRPDLWLDFGERYTHEDIIDRWLRSKHGDDVTLDSFAEAGFHMDEIPQNEIYNYSYHPGNETRHPLYNVYLVRARKALMEGKAAAGIEHPGWDDELFEWYYRGTPQWRPTYATEAPEEYDMTGVLYKFPQFIMDISAPTCNPWSVETASMRPDFGKFVINAATCDAKGLEEDDLIYVENMDGVVIGPYPVHRSELIHPECIGVAGGNGHIAGDYADYQKKNIPYNRLLSTKWDKVDVITGAIDVGPRLKITKA